VNFFDTGVNLAPLDLLRDRGEIYVGAMTLRARAESRARGKNIHVADNALLLEDIPAEGPNEVGIVDGRVAWYRGSSSGLRRETRARFVDKPWHVVRYLDLVLKDDCAGAIPRSIPNVVIDGDVRIEEDVTIEPFSYIVGPTYIGRGAVIKAHSVIRNSVIGEGCRVGGEISSCTFFPYSNKQHDGFLGHSVVGSWVNIGAGATGSNLKNTYGEIRIDGASTEMNYLGQIIGDHTKIGIQAVMNTGSVYGICANIFAGAGALPKRIPDFAFGEDRADLESVIRTARIVMLRRGQELLSGMEKRIRSLYE